MDREEPEAFLREMLAPLSTVRPGESPRRVPFSHEAVANAFVMLGLLPEARRGDPGRVPDRTRGQGFPVRGADRRAERPPGRPRVPVPYGERVTLRLNGATLTPGGAKLWFWPPVAPEAKRLRVIVSTLWEAAWAEVAIPGRS